MTYADLLKATAERKTKVIRQLNAAVNHPQLGFLSKAEIERDPGMVAWLWLAEGFCRTLAENWEEIWSSADELEREDIGRIYVAYEESDPDIYNLLPVEAQLFTE